MTKILRFVIALLIFSSILGPAGKLPLNLEPINIYLSDILIVFLFIYLIINVKKIYPVLKNNIPAKIFIIFTLFALLTLLISPINLTYYEILVSSLYLIRYLFYFGIYISACYLLKTDKQGKSNLIKYLDIGGLLMLALSWFQYFLYPDLRNLSYLGWDPHYKRIFALIFDPNYLGLFLIYYFFLRITNYKKSLSNILILSICLLTIAFTYSRSTYLALFLAGAYYSWQNKKLIPYFFISLILILSLLLLPRPGGVGVKLERFFTIRERLSNWQSAGQIIKRHPFFGVGFNTLRYARKKYNQLPENWLTSHSAAGVDNSLLFVFVTTGLIGLTIYLYFLLVLFKKLNLLGRSVFIASVFHSLFLNSLFFSFILIWLWLICALSEGKVAKGNN
ncbi:hypothetical protein A2153_04525 [Candidatus Gottesmanbacteria bacterium RBG_16_38_7b]|uniref:O-antigen ligase-related domain-containing protein n=2 Tax=Candidatus Gottesmaniibacteriota TaxID=1752720 RepID=A0A1F5YHT5_9BACT|nr:MAG: hypothetical protein A2153_04525 [Candidatus Gottesmanbacteria bacterium RBG_16_38_7b]OGG31005.1 MAG: hypothetical protein A3I51_06135 [Candidatus Gottesmanbacteria bacterium RIFCSPLOWO2_02_FULL_38_8]